MNDENQVIKIVSVDREAIAIGAGTKGQWSVPFKLSASPDQSWQKNLYEVQKSNTNLLKRKMQIVGDSMVVEVFPTDDLQKILDVLKIEIAETNALCVKDYQQKLKIREELEVLQKLQRDATQKFKDDSDKLAF